MNTISKIHQRFSEYLKNSRVLTNPEEFLGENYEAVLNFWLILDDLSEEQLRTISECYLAFYNENRSEYNKASNLAWEDSREVVGWNYAIGAGWAALEVANSWVVLYATTELIGMHKILEDHQQPLTFFEMFLKDL